MTKIPECENAISIDDRFRIDEEIVSGEISFKFKERRNHILAIPLDKNFLTNFRSAIFREEKYEGMKFDEFYREFYSADDQVWDEFVACLVKISRVSKILHLIGNEDFSITKNDQDL